MDADTRMNVNLLPEEGGMRKIVFYPASEWEKFQMRIGKLTIKDVSDIIEMHNLSTLLGDKEGAVTLLVPSNE